MNKEGRKTNARGVFEGDEGIAVRGLEEHRMTVVYMCVITNATAGSAVDRGLGRCSPSPTEWIGSEATTANLHVLVSVASVGPPCLVD